MTKLKLLVELEYDAEMMYAGDDEAENWFFEIVLKDGLFLHSDEIGDCVGTVTVLEVL